MPLYRRTNERWRKSSFREFSNNCGKTMAQIPCRTGLTVCPTFRRLEPSGRSAVPLISPDEFVKIAVLLFEIQPKADKDHGRGR